MAMNNKPYQKYLLYAEDDLDDQQMFVEIMEMVDPTIQVEVFENGLPLFEHLNSIADDQMLPSCIVLDINMPMWDGIRTLEALKLSERFSSIPVCLLTTSSKVPDDSELEQTPPDAFFTKPVKIDDMISIGKQFAVFCEQQMQSHS